MPGLHERRVAGELNLLEQMAERNRGTLRITACGARGEGARIGFALLGVPGVIWSGGPAVAYAHPGEIRLPRFFPAVPIEIYLSRPVFHPNVDPANGFVCLWSDYSPAYNCTDALLRLRRILAWDLWNASPAQVIHTAALEWYRDPRRGLTLPLTSADFHVPEAAAYQPAGRAPRRKRLQMP